MFVSRIVKYHPGGEPPLTMGLFKRKGRDQIKWQQPEDSIGNLLEATAFVHVWEAIGPARIQFDNDLAQKITKYLQKCSDFVPGEITWSLYMVGRGENSARPTITFCNGEAQTRKRVKNIISASGIIEEYPGFAIMECSKPPGWGAVKFLGNEEANSDQYSTAVRSNNTQEISTGTSLSIRRNVFDSQANYATAGPFLRHKNDCYLLTAAHVFTGCQPPIFSETGPESDFTCSFDDEDEDHEDTEFVEKTTTGSLSTSTSQNDRSTSDSTASTYLSRNSIEMPQQTQPSLVVEAEDVEGPRPVDHKSRSMEVHVFDTFSSSSLGMPLSLDSQDRFYLHPFISSSDGQQKALDYMLVRINPEAIHTSEPTYLKAKSDRDIAVATNLDKDCRIVAYTGSSGVVTGRLSATPSFVLATGAQKAQELWTIELDGSISMGDSGSWVVDASSGLTYGHIVAGSPGTGYAYVVPFRDVLKDLQERFHGTWEVLSSIPTQHSNQSQVNTEAGTQEVMSRSTPIAQHLIDPKLQNRGSLSKPQSSSSQDQGSYPKTRSSSFQVHERQILQSFFEQLDGFWESYAGPSDLVSPHRNARFLDLQKFRSHMTPSVVGSLLKAVLSEEDLDEIDIVANTVIKDFTRLFALLLKLEQGRQICNFMRYEALKDSNLPLRDGAESPGLPQMHANFWDDFRKEQHYFFPFVFGELARQPKLASDRILPFIDSVELQNGGYATISRVEVSTSFNTIDNRRNKYPKKDRRNIFVLKQYKPGRLDHYNNEKRAYTMLQGFSSQREGLMRFFGTFQHGDTYVIVLEWADRGTLGDFFKTADPPTEPEDIRSFWMRILKLTSGLKTISTGSSASSHSQQGYQGIHQDIKPENILVCSDDIDDTECNFKLADLGTAHFTLGTSGQDDMIHVDNRGTREFGAPEAARDESNDTMRMGVTAKVDVWSLACVLSVAATWLLHNKKGVLKYEKKRQEATAYLPHKGCFHDGVAVLGAVKDHHIKLRQDAKNRNDTCTEEVIRVIEMGMYNCEDRPNAQTLKKASEEAVRDGEAKDQCASGEQSPAQNFQFPRVFSFPQTPTDSPQSPVKSVPVPPIKTTTLLQEKPISPCDGNVLPKPKKPIPYFSLAAGLEWLKKQKAKGPKPELPSSHLRDDYLDNRDHVFLIDRAATMKPYWQDVQNVVLVLSYIVKKTDHDGLDLYMIPELTKSKHRDSSTMKERVRDKGTLDDPDRPLDINRALEEILFNYRARVRASYNSRPPTFTLNPRRPASKSGPKPLSLYVLTDGKWAPKTTGEPPIRDVISTLKECKFPQHQVGIQFIQFGTDDADATLRLQYLDSGLESKYQYDIVDATQSSGNIWKMLVGALNEWFDGDDNAVQPTASQAFIQQT